MPASFAELAEALTLPLPDSPSLVLDGCRRLLGPNLYSDQCGAVGDGLSPGFDPARMLDMWESDLAALLADLGQARPLQRRPFQGGGSLFLSAPVDQLMTAAYQVEAAWYLTACRLLDIAPLPRAQILSDLSRISVQEANPGLVALVEDAARRGIDRLLDDDSVTLGQGTGARTWDCLALPAKVNWSVLHDIPLALVTGTNGKTTTTRLIAAMGLAAGKVSGLSSTEFVKVGDDVLAKGDYSGPAGARLLLRDARLEIGVLEVARGGILRRGVPVTRARAAVVTNVAADHLGQYGIYTVEELAQVKLAVRRGLAQDGALILNAGDAILQAAARDLAQQAIWFGLDPDFSEIRTARRQGRPCAWFEAGWLILSDGQHETRLIAAADMPLTLGGAALYNIENALGAALAARALGLPDSAIRTTLAAFQSNATDNPGRANEFSVNGARVFVDFAHNPHSIAAVTSALATLPARHRAVLLMHAGDRSDLEIQALVEGAFALRPDLVVAAENPKYLRGRDSGIIPGLIRSAAIDQGCPPDQVILAPSPKEGAKAILDRLQPGDIALLLVHADRQEIFDLIQSRAD